MNTPTSMLLWIFVAYLLAAALAVLAGVVVGGRRSSLGRHGRTGHADADTARAGNAKNGRAEFAALLAFQDMGKAVRVVFINSNSGQIIARSEVPLEQLPDAFDVDTTIQMKEMSFRVERAEPATSVEFAQTGQLELILRPIETVPVSDILYSLPTICGQLPALDPALDRSRCLVLHEDDWRQREFVSSDHLGIIDEQCAAIGSIYADHAQRVGDLTAFDSIHVRISPATPITPSIALEQIEALLPAAVRRFDGVSFHRGSGAVPHSFASGYRGCVLYGLIAPNGVHVLAVHGDDTAEVEPLRTLGLRLVDWVSCRSS